ncbi:MAG TPA: MFS transporter [Kofleriaceae bacterium]|nr:MFS transporter [Kofleriaceae bacterium]
MIKNRYAILALLTGLNFLNYIDRAVVSAVVDPMQKALDLSDLEVGTLNAAFIIGYFLTSPFFGARADKGARTGLIALGVAIWSIATVASGMATGYWSLLAARVTVGVGEASYATLAPTIIDDITPPDRKNRALAIFYLAIPLGYAMGYILGGFIGKRWGWSMAFYTTGGPGIALALSCLAIAEPTRKLAAAKGKIIDGLRVIARIPLFRRGVLGYCAYTAAVSAFAFWAPKYLLETFPGELDLETANRYFGLVLIIGGAVGTFIGGRWADRALARLPAMPANAPYDAPANKAASNVLLRVCAIGMVIAAPLAVLAFLVPSAKAFFALAFFVEVGLFLSTSPINAMFLRSVPTERRASAMAGSIFAIHLFGDLWSASALGLLRQQLVTVVAMMALPLVFALSAYWWWPRESEAR